MHHRMRSLGWVCGACVVVVGCREANPNFVEPPVGTTADSYFEPTTTGASSTSLPTSGESTSAGTVNPSDGSSGTTSEPLVCVSGEIRCDGNEAQICDDGEFVVQDTCSVECIAGVGCVDCEPATTQCVNEMAQICGAMGVWQDSQYCDPVLGLACDNDIGKCVGDCALDSLGATHEGCEFYAVTLPKGRPDAMPMAEPEMTVILINRGQKIAQCQVDQKGMMAKKTVLSPGLETSVEVTPVPALRLPNIEDGTESVRVPDGAYHVRCDQPVVAYQFDPALKDPEVSSDASLLLPTHTAQTEYMAASLVHDSHPDGQLPGFYAVVGHWPDTTVKLTPPADHNNFAPGAGVQADGSGQVEDLGPGEVLLVLSAKDGDVSGAGIQASRPVGVFSGHKCAPRVGHMCDHMQAAIPPLATLGRSYQFMGDTEDEYFVRVIATEDATQLTIFPGGTPDTINMARGHKLYKFDGPRRIVADKPVLLAEFLPGADSGESMFIVVPEEQYLGNYTVYSSPGYYAHGAQVVGPLDAQVVFNGQPLPLEAIPNTEYGAVRYYQALDQGVVEISSMKPIGVHVLGVGPVGSFATAAGTGLAVLP